jgi:putative FmdB family regulatory protein
MPIYDYACQRCGHRFELLVLAATTPVCPACGSGDLTRLLSAPAVQTSGTRALGLEAARKRDQRQATEITRAQREYELGHDD